jgi:hypothetical protein
VKCIGQFGVIQITNIQKRKEETNMAAKKMNITTWGFMGILIIAICFFLPVASTMAETLKFKVSNVATKVDSYPVGDVDGHNIIFVIRDGLFVLEDGEIGSFKALVNIDFTVGKGGSYLGYFILTFLDGSAIVGTFQPATLYPDPEGKVSSNSKGSGEIISGSGRFKGIKGTQTFTSKVLKPLKGEIQGKGYGEFTLTYTLPPK